MADIETLYNVWMPYIIEENSALDGSQIVFRFENNFGASVIRHSGSYGHEKGLCELAVIKFDGIKWDFYKNSNFPEVDDCGIVGYLNFSEVFNLLSRIKSLEVN